MADHAGPATWCGDQHRPGPGLRVHQDPNHPAGGIKRQIRIFRLPDENPHRAVPLERRIDLKDQGDNALYLCLTQEDGHLVWSSPIYIFC